jgi:hypothetical protein
LFGFVGGFLHKSRLFGNRWLNVRFTPISGHRPTRRACPLSATSRHGCGESRRQLPPARKAFSPPVRLAGTSVVPKEGATSFSRF